MVPRLQNLGETPVHCLEQEKICVTTTGMDPKHHLAVHGGSSVWLPKVRAWGYDCLVLYSASSLPTPIKLPAKTLVIPPLTNLPVLPLLLTA